MQQQSPYDAPAPLVSARMAGATATGGTNTAVVVWGAALVTDNSGIFTQTSSAAAGDAFTVVRPGVYRIDFFAALAAAGDLQIGIGLNSSATNVLNGSPVDFAAVDASTVSEGIIACTGFTSATAADLPLLQCGVTRRFLQGDVIRFFATAAVTIAADNSRVFVNQIAY